MDKYKKERHKATKSITETVSQVGDCCSLVVSMLNLMGNNKVPVVI